VRRRLHLPLFLLALASAVAVKVAVNEARQLTEVNLNAQVQYNLPKGVMILEPVKNVQVRLRGERNEIATLTPFNVQVEVSLRESELGQVDISEERLVVRGPAAFDVVSKEPNFFTLTVEEVESRVLPIRAQLTGEPAAGALPGPPELVPAEARIEGPRSRIRDIVELKAPVSLEGHAFTFEEEAAIVSPDPLVRVVEPRQVLVRVPLTVPGSKSQMDELLEPRLSTEDS
jgi:hypothetical protein